MSSMIRRWHRRGRSTEQPYVQVSVDRRPVRTSGRELGQAHPFDAGQFGAVVADVEEVRRMGTCGISPRTSSRREPSSRIPPRSGTSGRSSRSTRPWMITGRSPLISSSRSTSAASTRSIGVREPWGRRTRSPVIKRCTAQIGTSSASSPVSATAVTMEMSVLGGRIDTRTCLLCVGAEAYLRPRIPDGGIDLWPNAEDESLELPERPNLSAASRSLSRASPHPHHPLHQSAAAARPRPRDRLCALRQTELPVRLGLRRRGDGSRRDPGG